MHKHKIVLLFATYIGLHLSFMSSLDTKTILGALFSKVSNLVVKLSFKIHYENFEKVPQCISRKTLLHIGHVTIIQA